TRARAYPPRRVPRARAGAERAALRLHLEALPKEFCTGPNRCLGRSEVLLFVFCPLRRSLAGAARRSVSRRLPGATGRDRCHRCLAPGGALEAGAVPLGARVERELRDSAKKPARTRRAGPQARDA